MPRCFDADRRRSLLAAGWSMAGLSWSSGAGAQAQAGGPILLGQSVPLSGPAQHLGIEYQRGWQMAIDVANAQGGVGGRRIELISYDDAYEPERAEANTRDLLDADRVFALVGYVGTEATQRSLALAVKAGVPMVAPLTGAESLRRQPTRWLWHLRPGLDAELGLVAHNLSTLMVQRVALLIQADADGAAGLESWGSQAAAVKLPEPVGVIKVQRNSTGQVELKNQDLRAATQALLAVKPQAVVLVAAYASTATVIRMLREANYAGGVYTTSLSSTAAMGPMLGERAAGVSITQVVPSPFDAARPVVAAYQSRLRVTGSAAPEHASLEGWVAAQACIEALRRMPRGGRRDQFMAALEGLSGLDLGGLTLRWDALHRQALGQANLMVLDASGRPRR